MKLKPYEVVEYPNWGHSGQSNSCGHYRTREEAQAECDRLAANSPWRTYVVEVWG